MKTFTTIRPGSCHYQHFALPRHRKLVAQWQGGIETMSGYAQRKLRLSLAPSSPPSFALVTRQPS